MLPATERALLHRVAVAQRDGRAPSLVAGVLRNGALAWWGARGAVDGAPPDADTGYRIGSITKTFVAVLIMRLRDEGKLALTDPVGDYLPDTAFERQTIGQLLSHTAGLTSESPGAWWERVAGGDFPALSESMRGEHPRYVPGTRLHYSNVGFGVLGEVVARLRGTSWLDAVQAELLDPLGMRRTTAAPVAPHASGWAVHPHADVLLPEPAEDAGAMGPAGQLWSTVADLARWAAFLGGDTGDVLAADTMTEMRQPATVDDGDTWATGWGLGIQLRRSRGRRLAGHGGSMPGFLATVNVDAATGDGVLLATNTTSGVPLNVIADDLFDLLDAHEPALPEPWHPMSEVDGELLALTGTWYWGPTPVTVTLLAGRWLDLTPPGGGRASRFRPAGAGTWTGLDGYYAGETLRVVRHPDERVSHLDLATFVFTRTPYDPAADVPGGVDPAGWR